MEENNKQIDELNKDQKKENDTKNINVKNEVKDQNENQIIEKKDSKNNNDQSQLNEDNKKNDNSKNQLNEKVNEKKEENNNSNQEKDEQEDYEIEREFSIDHMHQLHAIEEKKEEKIKKEEKKEEKISNLKIDEIKLEVENLKSNKEYNDNNDDITSARFPVKNNDKYLIKDEKSKPNTKDEKDVSDNEYESDREDEEKKEDLFPFKIIGDSIKKSQKLGQYNSRYLEIDSLKGLFKRYKTSKDYPNKPNDIVEIKNFKLIRKLKKVKDYYDLEITYFVMKKGEKIEKVENYRFRHFDCRNKWFDALLALWRYLIKGNPVPKFTFEVLLFVDDKIGIVQEIKESDKSKGKASNINLRHFKILSMLGVGGFGTVYKIKHNLTDKIYAMKVMNKNYIINKKYLHYVVSEFEIMKSLSGFPFVLDLHYCFQSANYLYLIIDYCPNGDFTKIKYINNMKLFFAEVILAFEHIHKHNIIYRDLKPENILLDSTGHIKICDFNLSKDGVPKGKRADSFCGSPMYLSPEMLGGKGVDYRCDIYGIGLLMYEIATGLHAFNANNVLSLYELIRENRINFNVNGIYGEIKDLLEKILVKDPEKRISLEEIKNHPYFQEIDFNKVLKKEYGPIITGKRGVVVENESISKEEKEKLELMKFKLQQQKLDENKEYSYLEGKISVKEMCKDLKRRMKNIVKEFYYVKKEDIEKTKDFELDLKGNVDISNFIKDK